VEVTRVTENSLFKFAARTNPYGMGILYPRALNRPPLDNGKLMGGTAAVEFRRTAGPLRCWVTMVEREKDDSPLESGHKPEVI